MNYLKHYNLLILKAKHRSLIGYSEKHHIISKCMGGLNDKENIVRLTPEEHYVAHQLLIKMYPDNRRLAHAAQMMAGKNDNHKRNNKLYGWIKKRCSKALLGVPRDEKTKQNMRKPKSAAGKRNIQKAAAKRRGKPNGLKGRKFSEETLLKMRNAKIGKSSNRKGKAPWNKGIKGLKRKRKLYKSIKMIK